MAEKTTKFISHLLSKTCLLVATLVHFVQYFSFFVQSMPIDCKSTKTCSVHTKILLALEEHLPLSLIHETCLYSSCVDDIELLPYTEVFDKHTTVLTDSREWIAGIRRSVVFTDQPELWHDSEKLTVVRDAQKPVFFRKQKHQRRIRTAMVTDYKNKDNRLAAQDYLRNFKMSKKHKVSTHIILDLPLIIPDIFQRINHVLFQTALINHVIGQTKDIFKPFAKTPENTRKLDEAFEALEKLNQCPFTTSNLLILKNPDTFQDLSCVSVNV